MKKHRYNEDVVKEIEDDEFEQLKECVECLNAHHNRVSTHFKGCYPRHPADEKIASFKRAVIEGKSRIAVIKEDNKIVGLCKIDLKGVLDYLVVLPQYRQSGYGDELMKWALAEFEKLQIRNIELHVVYGNETVHFYEKYGFKIQSYIMEKIMK